MRKADLVSCVISTYKRKNETLERAAFSIIRQTYPSLELIIVNDAPGIEIDLSNIEKEAKKYDREFYYIENSGSHGACNTRNIGAQAARGDYLAFLDDDDEWLPNKIEKQMEAFNCEDIGLVWCQNYVVKEGNKARHLAKNLPCTNESQYKGLLEGNYIGSTSFPLMRKKAFLEAGMFDSEIQSSQDCDLWIRIVKNYRAVYIPEPLVNYYVSIESISKDTKKRIAGYDYLLKKYEKEYSENPETHVKRLNSIVGTFIFYGEYSSARQYLRMIIELYGINSVNCFFLCRRFIVGIRKRVMGY